MGVSFEAWQHAASSEGLRLFYYGRHSAFKKTHSALQQATLLCKRNDFPERSVSVSILMLQEDGDKDQQLVRLCLRTIRIAPAGPCRRTGGSALWWEDSRSRDLVPCASSIGSWRRGLFSSPGGEGGIRTHGTLTRTTVFETAPIGHSGTSPCRAAARLIPTRPIGRNASRITVGRREWITRHGIRIRIPVAKIELIGQSPGHRLHQIAARRGRIRPT